jgi:hypothetical protein
VNHLCSCGAQLPPSTWLCTGCARKLAGQLRAVPDLLDELDTTMIRDGSNWTEPGGLAAGGSGSCRPGCDHDPDSPSCVQGTALAWSERAGDAARELRTTVGTWAYTWDREHPISGLTAGHVEGPLCGAWMHLCRHGSCDQILRRKVRQARDRLLATAGGQARLLGSQPLAGRPWAPVLAKRLDDAVHEAETTIWPPEMETVGQCDCGMQIMAAVGQATVVCRWCSLQLDVADRRTRMLTSTTATAPAPVLERAGIATVNQVRWWRSQGYLTAVDINRAGQPLYRVRDVDHLATHGTPKTPKPAVPTSS